MMSIIEKIIEQQGENSTTVQVMRQFFPVIEKAEAALQSQDREGYAGVTVWLDGVQCTKIITRIQYEGSRADELLRHFEAARAAIDHARHVEGDKE